MTTPQEMPAGVPVESVLTEPPEKPSGILYTFATKLVAWVAFMTCFAMLIGLLVFAGLALWRGIIWLWPGGGLG